MKPCSALIEERRGAAIPLHAYHFLPPNVKHIKLNVPANLTQLFVCSWGACAHVCLCAYPGGPKWHSYVSVCSAVWAHSSMLVFTCKRGMKWDRQRLQFHWYVHVGRGYTSWNTLWEGWGNMLLSKIIGLLHPVILLSIMKASLQFSNYYSMPILFLSNKEEHWCKTKWQDSISCLCLKAIRRRRMYTPSKYHPQYPAWNIWRQSIHSCPNYKWHWSLHIVGKYSIHLLWIKCRHDVKRGSYSSPLKTHGDPVQNLWSS